MDGRSELVLTPLELLDRLSSLITPPRVHKHRYCGVLAPNARLRQAVIAFIVEPAVIERILTHVGEPTDPPAVLPARAPPQLDLGFDQDPDRLDPSGETWPDMDQSAGAPDEAWN